MPEVTNWIHVHNMGTGKKDIEVEAVLYGPVAVHRMAPGDTGQPWRVTHIASGAFIVAVTTKSLAVKLAKDLAKLDWSKVTSHKSRKALAKIAPLRRAILEKHGVLPLSYSSISVKP